MSAVISLTILGVVATNVIIRSSKISDLHKRMSSIVDMTCFPGAEAEY